MLKRKSVWKQKGLLGITDHVLRHTAIVLQTLELQIFAEADVIAIINTINTLVTLLLE